MDAHSIDWDNWRLFLAVARAQGLAGAAAATGKSPATLGRRMLRLERRVGLTLFDRTARGYNLTADGRALFERAEALEAVVQGLEGNRGRTPLVRVSAGSWMTRLLAGEIAQLAAPDDGYRLRFIPAEHRLDVARREALIGIRNQRPSELGLAGRRIARVHFAAYAAPPDTDRWIRLVADTPSAQWLDRQTGAAVAVEVTAPRTALDLALAGAGRVVLPRFVGDSEPGLVRVTDPIVELSHEQWVVAHHEDRHLPEVREVIERIAAVIRRRLA